MSKNDGGPAFPVPIFNATDVCVANALKQQSTGELSGMSLRDYFAGQVVVAIYADWRGTDDADVVKEAYRVADAMLKAREQ
jgi:hypothetical protein